MRLMRYAPFVDLVSFFFLILSVSPLCTPYMCCLDFFLFFPPMKSDADLVPDACFPLLFFFLIFSLAFPLSRVGAHCRLCKPFSGHHQGLCFFKITYCLFAHDNALLMEYIILRYITLQLPSGRILAADGSGLVSSLFDPSPLHSQQVFGGNLRYWLMYLATHAHLLILMFLVVQIIYPLCSICPRWEDKPDFSNSNAI